MFIHNPRRFVLIRPGKYTELCRETPGSCVFNLVGLPRILSSQFPFWSAGRIDPMKSPSVVCLKCESVAHVFRVTCVQRLGY